MTALYNEIDPFAADWLENLILVGAIAPGIVDRRSVIDLEPEYLSSFTQVHLFAGIGVWSHALRQAGWADDRPVWTASFPCQPFSAAGKGDGFDDERHLWPFGHWLISVCRPSVLFGEQVSSKDGLAWLDLVHADMEATGYAFGALDLCSAGVGAPHIRQRTHWMAYADSPVSEQFTRVRHGPAYSQGARTLRQPDGRSNLGWLVDDVSARLEGRGEGHYAAGRRAQSSGPVAPPSSLGGVEIPSPIRLQGRPFADRELSAKPLGLLSVGTGDDAGRGLANPDGWDASAEWQQRGGEQRFVTNDGFVRDECGRAGPVNGFWGLADWLFCRDGKWRPVEPGTFPLVNGAPNRVGALRGYGNAINAPLAVEFIKAGKEFLDALHS